jgi:hypothetical protein
MRKRSSVRTRRRSEVKEFSALLPAKEDRKFELGSEVFEWVTPYWEDLAALYDEDVAATQAALADALSDEAAEKTNGSAPTTRDNVKQTQARIKLFLPVEDRARFDKLTMRKEDPVGLHLWGEVFKWLLEVATGRPTQPPSASEPGGGNEEASSQGGSRSRAGRRKG